MGLLKINIYWYINNKGRHARACTHKYSLHFYIMSISVYINIYIICIKIFIINIIYTSIYLYKCTKFKYTRLYKSYMCKYFFYFTLTDCLHLQLYGDSKDRYKQGQTKASLSLQHFLGVESGFTLDKESNTIAIICQDVTVVLAFDTRERLIQWQVKISNNLGEGELLA